MLLDRDAYGPVGPGARQIVRAVAVAPYLLVLALAVPGLAALALTPARGLLLGFVVYYNMLHVVTYGQDRFRLPVMPVLFLLAAEAWLRWRTGTLWALGTKRRIVAVALALLAAAVVLPGFF